MPVQLKTHIQFNKSKREKQHAPRVVSQRIYQFINSIWVTGGVKDRLQYLLQNSRLKWSEPKRKKKHMPPHVVSQRIYHFINSIWVTGGVKDQLQYLLQNSGLKWSEEKKTQSLKIFKFYDTKLILICDMDKKLLILTPSNSKYLPLIIQCVESVENHPYVKSLFCFKG